MTDLRFRWLAASERGRWDAFSAACAAGPFADAAWMDAMAAAGVPLAVAVCEQGDRIVAGTLFRDLSRWGMRLRLPPPLSAYQGPWLLPREVDDADRKARFAEDALACLAEGMPASCDRIQMQLSPSWIDVRPLTWKGWSARPRYTYVLDLGKPLDLNRAVVKQVRKAGEAGLVCQPSTDWALLHRLWRASLDRQGAALGLGEGPFVAACRVLQDRGRLLAWSAGTAGGEAWFANAVLIDGDRAYDWVAGALKEKAPTGGNQLLKTSVAADLAARGIRFFDLVGGDHPGIAAYKRSLGASLVPHLEAWRNVTWLGRLAGG